MSGECDRCGEHCLECLCVSDAALAQTLKPCPFCGQGSTYRGDYRGGEWSHDVEGCFLNGVYISGAHAIHQWNAAPDANARLIAAAPALYDALLEAWADPAFVNMDPGVAFRMDAALKLARGEEA